MFCTYKLFIIKFTEIIYLKLSTSLISFLLIKTIQISRVYIVKKQDYQAKICND